MQKVFSKKGLVTFLLAVFITTVILPLGQEAKAVQINKDESKLILEPPDGLEGTFPNIKEKCGTTPYTDSTGLVPADAHVVEGNVSFGKLGATKNYYNITDEIEEVKVSLMTDYEFGGEGNVYCETKLDTNGYFRFEAVYPGTYYLVINEIISDKGGGFTDWVGSTLCAASGWLGWLPLIPDKEACLKATSSGLVLSGHLTVTKDLTNKFDTRKDPGDPTGLPVIKVKETSLLSFIMPDVFGWIEFQAAKTLNTLTRVFFVDTLLIMRGLDNNAVEAGWSKVRDISNFMLILALIIIALANVTRFNLEAYTAKSLIPRLVLAGIFINFSLLLTRFIVDIANVLTVYLSANTDFAHMWSIGEAATLGFLFFAGGTFASIFMLIFYFMAFFATITILLVLIVRFAVIWLCAIFSPIVFLFAVLPFTRSLTGMWWKYLIKFAFIGPVMALLMYVASYL